MTVRDLALELLTYNGDAKVTVVAHDRTYPFRLGFGGRDGDTKTTTDSVHIVVPELNGIGEEVKGKHETT